VPNGELGPAEVGATGVTVEWPITNTGTAATGALVLTNSNPLDFGVENTCPTTLDAGAACSIRITFTPRSPGRRSGTLSLTEPANGRFDLPLGGSGQYRVSLIVQGGGRVTGLGAAACTGQCSLLVDPAQTLALQAQTDNGSNLLFRSWSVPSCPGLVHDCSFAVAGTTAITAAFAPVQNNIIFMSAANVEANLGGVAAYDALCNTFASAAGFNTLAGNGFIAMLSDDTGSFLDRLGPTVRGWVGTDGRPIVDRWSELLVDRRMLFPLHYDQHGGDRYLPNFTRFYWTGTATDGTPGVDNCSNWTSNSATAAAPFIGFGNRGPFTWTGTTNGSTQGCSISQPIVCLGNSRTTALNLTPEAGKRMWVTDAAFQPGAGITPDAHCAAEAPPGVNTSAALVAYTDQSAAAVLDLNANYVRIDGISVGSGAQIAAQAPLTGVWLTGSGATLGASVWTGQATLLEVGTQASTCANWTGTTGMSPIGSAQGTDRVFWNLFGSQVACTQTGISLYCVER